MRIRIYQVDERLDEKQLIFRGSEDFEKQYGGRIPAEIYKKTFDDDLDVDDPEQVFSMFNVSRPAGYTGRSLSVSDVVEFADKGVFYFCDRFGFKPVLFTVKADAEGEK